MVWGSHITAIPGILHELVQAAGRRSALLPYLRGWGREIALDSVRYEADADTLRLDYGVFSEQGQEESERQGIYLEKSKERRRLERAWEVRLPAIETAASGWDITVDVPPSLGEQVEQTGWHCVAERTASDLISRSRITVRIAHAKSEQDYIPVQVAVQRIAGSKTIRINGKIVAVTDLEERDPAAHTAKSMVSPESLKLDVASIASVTTTSSASSASVIAPTEVVNGNAMRRSSQQSIYNALVAHNKRAYTGFLALLQSPAPKWKAVTEIKRVSVSSYISIDTSAIPVYRYEATFVNTSIWDVFSVFTNSQARLAWDKASGLERFDLLGELSTAESQDAISEGTEAAAAEEGATSFHAASWKGTWPVVPRYTTLLRTAYKSPSTIHVFYTSVPDDPEISKHTPVDTQTTRAPNSILSQIHLQAVAIDQISPTTTTLTLVDQHDPKGWSKSSYSAMAGAVAGIGEHGECARLLCDIAYS